MLRWGIVYSLFLIHLLDRIRQKEGLGLESVKKSLKVATKAFQVRYVSFNIPCFRDQWFGHAILKYCFWFSPCDKTELQVGVHACSVKRAELSEVGWLLYILLLRQKIFIDQLYHFAMGRYTSKYRPKPIPGEKYSILRDSKAVK